MEALNAQQQAAVESTALQLLVRAGAGTGKTRVLVARAIRLALQGLRVRILTFTRAAAREVKARLARAELPDRVQRRIQVDTHHGLAAGLLAKRGLLTGAVIDEIEEKAVEKEAQARGESAAALRQRNGLVLYSELIPAALQMLRSEEPLDEDCGGALLVDEAHDSTREEWRLVYALEPDCLTVVGDECQRVYGWRGAVALPAGPDWRELPLARNYRSGQAILDLANRLPIPGRVDLISECGFPGREHFWHCPDDDNFLDTFLCRPGSGSWAVLARTKSRLLGVQERLAQEGVATYAPCLAGKVWDQPESRRLLDHLFVVANPHDSLHLERCLRGSGWDDARVHRAEAGRAGVACSLWDWACAHEPADSPAASLLRQLASWRTGEPAAKEAAAWFAETAAPVEAVPADLTVPEFLRWLADPDRDAGQASEQPEAVYLGTIHSAKGLEWDGVAILGLEEGSLPLGRRKGETSDEAERIAEERRLLYVAITRAKNHMILANSDQRPGWRRGHTIESEPSRFVAELGL